MATEPLLAGDEEREYIEAFVASIIERGDISGLDDTQRRHVYLLICQRLRLDPLTTPLMVLESDGQQQFYMKRGGTDQLARIWNIERTLIQRATLVETPRGHVYEAFALGCLAGRYDEASGSVPIRSDASDEDVCNARMHCETKAMRRVVLALLGIGMLDESEIHTVRDRGKRERTNGQFAELRKSMVSAPVAGEAPATPLAAPITALERFEDDLAQWEGEIPVEALAAIWCDHQAAVGADGQSEALRQMLARAPAGTSKHSLNLECRITDACAKYPAMAALQRGLRETLATTPSVDALAMMWAAHQPTVRALEAWVITLAEKMAERAVRRADPEMKQPGAFLRAWVAREQATRLAEKVADPSAVQAAAVGPQGIHFSNH